MFSISRMRPLRREFLPIETHVTERLNLSQFLYPHYLIGPGRDGVKQIVQMDSKNTPNRPSEARS